MVDEVEVARAAARPLGPRSAGDEAEAVEMKALPPLPPRLLLLLPPRRRRRRAVSVARHEEGDEAIFNGEEEEEGEEEEAEAAGDAGVFSDGTVSYTHLTLPTKRIV